MAKIKNISGQWLTLADIGFELDIEELLDLDDLDINEVRDSADITLNIDNGYLVYVDENNTELSTEQSQQIQENNSDGVDLSNYHTKAEILALIANIPIGEQEKIMDIVQLPVYSVLSSHLKFGYSAYADSATFYKLLTTPYYINQPSIETQIVTDITGKGYFTGLMLPRLRTSDMPNRKITVFITIDGNQTSEEFEYKQYNSSSYRVHIGACYGTRSGKLESGGGLLLTQHKDGDNTISSNRRPQQFGIVSLKSDAHIIHPMQFLNDNALPKIKFNSSLKIHYQLNQGDMYSSSSYKNRLTPFYLLTDRP